MDKTKIKISFLISVNELAHGLEIIQALEPSYYPVSMNQMVRLVYRDYLAKMSIVSSPVPTERAAEIVKRVLGQAKWGAAANGQSNDEQELMKIQSQQQTLVQAHHYTKPESVVEPDLKELERKMMANISQAQSQSQVNVVTDFSPPTEDELDQ
jgi:hypothetical protein